MKHPAYVGVASELITYEATYAQVMTNILGTVIITRDLKGANELARHLQYRYRFVTLDGDVVNPGGAMTGGTVNKQTSSLLSRTRELEEVTASFREIERKRLNSNSASSVKKRRSPKQNSNESIFMRN